MQSTAYPLCIQPLLFSPNELSSCFFTSPTEDEISFLEIWENLVSSMPPEVKNDDGRSLRDGLGIHSLMYSPCML